MVPDLILSGTRLPISHFVDAAVEAEYAFRVERPLGRDDIGLEDLRRARQVRSRLTKSTITISSMARHDIPGTGSAPSETASEARLSPWGRCEAEFPA